MARLTLQRLGILLKERRGPAGLRETGRQIGISSATLSRLERGYLPDIGTFSKVCRWLRVDPSEVLGVPPRTSSKPQAASSTTTTAVSAHLRANRTPTPALAQALAELILAAHDAIDSGELPN